MIPINVDYVVGTGGIGSGILFKLEGEHSLGRNETRLAELTDYQDFCKQHIILHYVAVLSGDRVPIYAIGGVGNDAVGEELLGLMRQSGIDVDYVDIDDKSRTMYAVCYQYPNGEGGNLTASNSASDRVSVQQVRRFFDEVNPSGHGLVIAAPEVPLEARFCLLSKGRELGCFNVASLVTSEVSYFIDSRVFSLIDLLAINQDEAKAIVDFSGCKADGSDADMCYHYLKEQNPDICVIVTCGGDGAYAYQNGQKWFSPSVSDVVLSTAGAGDCFLGTVISALIRGIPMAQDTEEATIDSALQLAALSSAMKVACNDTIDFSINSKSLLSFALIKGIKISDSVMQRFF